MRIPSLKKAQTFPKLGTLSIGFVLANDDEGSELPTTHTLKPLDMCV